MFYYFIILEPPDQCYNPMDFGANYRGVVNVTIQGRPCLNWSITQPANRYPEATGTVGGHNYCRNPSGEVSKTIPFFA